MVTYDQKTKTIKMALHDLEHCGFDTDQFAQELFMAGIEIDLLEPETLIVDLTASVVVGEPQ